MFELTCEVVKQIDYVLKEQSRKPKRLKHCARKKVQYALKTGRLKRLPCEIADCEYPDTHAHHPDYDEPLDVLWLCPTHHIELHKHFA